MSLPRSFVRTFCVDVGTNRDCALGEYTTLREPLHPPALTGFRLLLSPVTETHVSFPAVSNSGSSSAGNKGFKLVAAAPICVRRPLGIPDSVFVQVIGFGFSRVSRVLAASSSGGKTWHSSRRWDHRRGMDLRRVANQRSTE
jgi:hypothetical protein